MRSWSLGPSPLAWTSTRSIEVISMRPRPGRLQMRLAALRALPGSLNVFVLGAGHGPEKAWAWWRPRLRSASIQAWIGSMFLSSGPCWDHFGSIFFFEKSKRYQAVISKGPLGPCFFDLIIYNIFFFLLSLSLHINSFLFSYAHYMKKKMDPVDPLT